MGPWPAIGGQPASPQWMAVPSQVTATVWTTSTPIPSVAMAARTPPADQSSTSQQARPQDWTAHASTHSPPPGDPPPILYLGVQECRALKDDPSNHVLAVTRMALESQSRAQHREIATGAPLGPAKARRVSEAGQPAQVTSTAQCGSVPQAPVERHRTNNIDNGKRQRNVAILSKFAMPNHHEYEQLYPESQEEPVEDLQGQFGRAGQGRVAHPPPCLSSISISNVRTHGVAVFDRRTRFIPSSWPPITPPTPPPSSISADGVLS
ncbi:hypothetical protein CMUS01_05659 [Colletotrichum musicola]|uniref:Uncharacterized protein n=1 Tax=Colletotrichum musicola TaxID=2175873 RepID=A0A8H6NJK6_9PEZI|nr:hypothetical protein CMUS01_05659 [Colletotrichum musicola]